MTISDARGIPSLITYDVIVAGGGPAGSTAAFFLSEAGKRVLVIEKARLPRYKTCGGGLSARFLRQQFPFSFDPIIKTDVSTVSYIFGKLEASIPIAPGAIGMVMRDELDAYLISHLRADVLQGAAVSGVRELPDGVEVETQDGRCFTAQYLIGADGANSAVAHALGLRARRLMAAAIEVEVPVTPELMRRYGQQLVFIFGEIRHGYLWIFPKQDHLSVGIGALRPKPGELQKKLKSVMNRCGIPLDGAPMRGHPIPIYSRRERIASARTLLVGDAAGLADPLSGEGIRFAIKSGRMAAEAILSGRPEGYQQAVFQSIGLNHHLSTLVAILFYFFEDLFLFLGTPNPFTTQAIVDMLSDRMTALEFFFFSAFTLPVFIATEVIARTLRRLGHARLSDRLRDLVYPQDVSRAYR